MNIRNMCQNKVNLINKVVFAKVQVQKNLRNHTSCKVFMKLHKSGINFYWRLLCWQILLLSLLLLLLLLLNFSSDAPSNDRSGYFNEKNCALLLLFKTKLLLKILSQYVEKISSLDFFCYDAPFFWKENKMDLIMTMGNSSYLLEWITRCQNIILLKF